VQFLGGILLVPQTGATVIALLAFIALAFGTNLKAGVVITVLTMRMAIARLPYLAMSMWRAQGGAGQFYCHSSGIPHPSTTVH
jgi:hypothetical protein